MAALEDSTQPGATVDICKMSDETFAKHIAQFGAEKKARLIEQKDAGLSKEEKEEDDD